MNEPTKERIEEAKTLLEQFSSGSAFLTAAELAQLIAKVKNDTLEVARDIVDCVRFTSGSDDFSGKIVEQAANEMLRQIVDKKVPT